MTTAVRTWTGRLEEELAQLREDGLDRSLWALPDDFDPRRNFASNDYLGLSRHPAVVEAAVEGARRAGAGSGASRLITGTTREVLELEAALAAYKAASAALVFSSGYHANLGVVSALTGAGDTVFCDRLVHASLLDAVRLSGARLVRFLHNSPDDLRRKIAAHSAGRSGAGSENVGSVPPPAGPPRRLIVTEGLFSMNGDIPPLKEILDVAAEVDAVVILDDAHATGVLGAAGSGSLEELGVKDHPLVRAGGVIQVGTLSKALGSHGGFVCGTASVIDYLVNHARPFIYTTALPPASVAAAGAALAVLTSTEGQVLVADLRRNCAVLRRELTRRGIVCLGDSCSPIAPVVLGEPEAATEARGALLESGFAVAAVRPPSVPLGGSRLRITVSAVHRENDLVQLADSLAEVLS